LSGAGYPIRATTTTRYEFVSQGPRGAIEKIVEITKLSRKNAYSFGFGNKMPGGQIDDRVESNNADISKIFATLLTIIRDFTAHRPMAELYFVGSTDQRTQVYQYLLTRYYPLLSCEFEINGIVERDGIRGEDSFDVHTNEKYLAFSIRKK
jgi:hypothetical protein